VVWSLSSILEEELSERRVAFINPFGTPIYDDIIRETLVPYADDRTAVDILHIENAPPNIDYYWPKHLIEAAVFERVMSLEEEGYHAVVIGCCYDPGVRVARELVDIPVVGPLEAAMNMASYFGHDYTIVTDHRKALPYLEDLVRMYGGDNCRGVRCIDWWVTEMVKDPAAVAKDAAAECLRALEEDDSEVAILGCTIIGGCLERQIRETGEYGDLPILNPNLLALKTAETLADLFLQGKYTISRRGYYQKQAQHDAEDFAEVRRRYRIADLEKDPATTSPGPDRTP
jgi:allantoin racemase